MPCDNRCAFGTLGFVGLSPAERLTFGFCILKLGAGICGKTDVGFVGFGMMEMDGVIVSCPLPTLIIVDAPGLSRLADDGTGVILAGMDWLDVGFDGDVVSDGCGLLVVGKMDIADELGTVTGFSTFG